MMQPPPPFPKTIFSPAFLREAGRSCARYVLDGGRLTNIDFPACQLHHAHLQLLPHSPGKKTLYPDRTQVETDLLRLRSLWHSPPLSTPQQLRFLLSFCKELERSQPGYRAWVRIWIREQQKQYQLDVRSRYALLLQHPRGSNQPVEAVWTPHPQLEPNVLHEMIQEALQQSAPRAGRSQRARINRCELLGEPVVIKQYAPNPAKWKRRLERSRARRAWAASRILENCAVPSIRGLGWLEVYQNGSLQESYFISRQLPPMETLRVWLRREITRMSPQQRIDFRHKFRSEILRLHQQGLEHADLKLSNILVDGTDPAHLTFYWIDLEDLHPNRNFPRTFVRNLYQLNGSLPRQISAAERKAFVSGFRRTFLVASLPGLACFVKRKTRKRHLTQLRRQRGV
jgi:tRNA A-37 threonylcarbamoyl transferase component Bud32